MTTVRVRQLLLKVASRCNINCSYCFEYNLADSSYRRYPKYMATETARQSIRRLLSHCSEAGISRVSIVFHGGEPLLLGAQGLDEMLTAIRLELRSSKLEYSIGMQSNGILFTREIGDVLRHHRCGIGISVDGPPRVNDRHRLTFLGEGTSTALEGSLSLLAREYRDLFAGTLSVVDPFSSPTEVIDYLRSHSPPEVDFLLPLYNHSRLPDDPTYVPRLESWLIRAFDYSNVVVPFVPVRMFQNIVRELCGAPSQVESIGQDDASLAIVGTAGQIEALDALKATYDGATDLNMNVFEHSLSQIDSAQLIRPLCSTCLSCEHVDVCGGGYLPHRYSARNGFDNPSIYCAALSGLIQHIAHTVERQLSAISSLAPAASTPGLGHV